jgi:hypothetical protein
MSKRKRLIIVLIIVIIVFDILAAVCLFSGLLGGRAEVNQDPVNLIASQTVNNHGSNIADIGFDSAITLDQIGPYIKSVDYRTLKPLTNNYLSSTGTGDSRVTYLVDATAVARVISVNSNWVNYLNNGNEDVFNDVLPDSKASQFIESFKGDQIAYHRLAFGRIYTQGSNIYVITQPQITLLRDGKSATVNDIFVFKLVKRGDTLIISDIEDVKLQTTPVAL